MCCDGPPTKRYVCFWGLSENNGFENMTLYTFIAFKVVFLHLDGFRWAYSARCIFTIVLVFDGGFGFVSFICM